MKNSLKEMEFLPSMPPAAAAAASLLFAASRVFF